MSNSVHKVFQNRLFALGRWNVPLSAVVRPDDPIADFGGVDLPTIRRWVARINSLSEPMPELMGTPEVCLGYQG